MPQSLTVGAAGGSSSGSSAKRQRSADSRDVQARPTSTSLNRSTSSLSKPRVRIPSYLDKSKVEIQQAFQDLEWKQRFRLFHALENPATSPFRVDRSQIVINRNRYGNVQPWDNSRVKLSQPLGGSDYVNASPIKLRSRGSARTDQSGTASEEILQENRYIATQGPKDGSVSHFWHMVMQETTGDIGVIVMLTQCYEANKEKCSQYFPAGMDDAILVLPKESEPVSNITDTEQDSNAPTSQDTVTLTSLTNDQPTGSILRILNLTINNTTKQIRHYLYHGWPDFGKPEAEDRLALLELIRQTRQTAGQSPRVIHCSAGVGRTGTFIALDFLMQEIEQGHILDPTSSTAQTDNPTIQPSVVTPTLETWGASGPAKVKTPSSGDFPSGEENAHLKTDLIYDTVNTLREQRMMMVMNELQYAFLYEVVREVFLAKYRARPEGAVVKSADSLENVAGEGVADLPRGKVIKVESGDGGEEGEPGDDGSEADTEIMEDQDRGEKMKDAVGGKMLVEGDPYDVVAPDHIKEGMSKEQ